MLSFVQSLAESLVCKVNVLHLTVSNLCKVNRGNKSKINFIQIHNMHFFVDHFYLHHLFPKCCTISRSSCPEVFCKKGLLRNFAKFTEKHLCQSLFYNKRAGMRSTTLIKRRLWHRSFPVNFAKLLRTHFLTRQLPSLLLNLLCCTGIINLTKYLKNFNHHHLSVVKVH